MKHVKLFTPGPGDVDEAVLREAAHPVLRHYGPEWMEIFNDTLALLRQFFKTRHDIFMVPGPASALLEMAIGSLTRPGDQIIIGTNGFFGDRLVDIAAGYGLAVIPFTAPLGKPLDPDVLRILLQENPRVQVVALVHHETSTTVLNPLQALAGVTKEAGKVLVADAVSSLGGVDLAVDDWGIGVCVSAANKCLEALPGIGFISVSPQAWELVDQEPGPGTGWYLNLRTWRKFAIEWGTWHPSPVTLPVNLILPARASMHRIVNAGLENQFCKYRRASQAVRTGMANLGYEMYVPEAYAAPVVTAVKARPEFELSELSKWLVAERGIAVGGALGPLSGKIIRIGHLGKAAEHEYLVDLLAAMEEFLQIRGISARNL